MLAQVFILWLLCIRIDEDRKNIDMSLFRRLQWYVVKSRTFLFLFFPDKDLRNPEPEALFTASDDAHYVIIADIYTCRECSIAAMTASATRYRTNVSLNLIFKYSTITSNKIEMSKLVNASVVPLGKFKVTLCREEQG